MSSQGFRPADEHRNGKNGVETPKDENGAPDRSRSPPRGRWAVSTVREVAFPIGDDGDTDADAYGTGTDGETYQATKAARKLLRRIAAVRARAKETEKKGPTIPATNNQSCKAWGGWLGMQRHYRMRQHQ